MAIKCSKIIRPDPNNTNNEQQPQPRYNNTERLQKLYHKYRPAGVKISNRSSNEKNAPSYSQVAKGNQKGKNKEDTNSTTSIPTQTVDHLRHNPNNKDNNNNSNLERKLDLILNKLDNMQKSINNLNDRIKKLEEWRAQFCNQTETNNTETVTLIDLTTPSSSPSKRVRMSTSSSLESDNKNSLLLSVF